MKLTNFELIKTTGDSSLNTVYHAAIDVETGMLWWKKTERLEIQRKCGGYWFFVESGKWTEGVVVDELARAWTAKTGQGC